MPTKTVEMFVSLKVPDTTAITALQTLQKIGFSRIKDVKRADYYGFLTEGDGEKFRKQISKVDILVNANKHYCSFSIEKDKSVKILVKSTKIEDFRDAKNAKHFLANINGNGSGILSTLTKRLGFKQVKKAERGTLWSLSIDADEKEARKIAEKAAKELLVNENYQEYNIL